MVDTENGALPDGQRSDHFSPPHSVRYFPWLTNLMNSVGTIWVFALVFLICSEIVLRTAFSSPIVGATEFLRYSMVGTVFLQLANTLHNNRFTRADMLMERLAVRTPIAHSVFHLVFNVFGIIVFAAIAWGTWGELLKALPQGNDPAGVFGVRGRFTILVWPLRAIVLAGSIAVLIEFLLQFVNNVAQVTDAIKQRSAQRAKAVDGDAGQPVGWTHILMLAGFFVLAAIVSQVELTKVQIGALSFIGMLALIYFGMHIGIALILLAFVGIWMMMGAPRVAMSTLVSQSNEFLRKDLFATVPFFVLMGLLVNASDIGKDTFDAARWALRRIKGGLGVSTVAANAIFAAITGSSIASAAVFAEIATPHMLRSGYTPRFSVGTVAGSSVLGVLIPPSLLLIVYSFAAEESVGELFRAAVIPGLLLAGTMGVSIIGMAYLWPRFVGRPRDEDVLDENIFSASYKMLPIIILVVAVIGGIYAGWFTPVEAGAAGSALALLMMVMRRRFSWRRLWGVLIETGNISVSILFLILAARIYTVMLALSGLPQEMGAFVSNAELGYLGFMALYVLVLIILGMFLDSISIMLVILPLVLPVVKLLGIDPVGFGIITVVGLEMGLLTPPLGLCVYVVKSTINDARISLGTIFIGSAPFVIIMFGVIVLLIAVPGLANMDPLDPFRALFGLLGSPSPPPS